MLKRNNSGGGLVRGSAGAGSRGGREMNAVRLLLARSQRCAGGEAMRVALGSFGGGLGLRGCWTAALAAAVIASVATPAWAGPEGEQVVRGNVTISRDGTQTLIRASDRSIINFRNFDIGANESVRFVQPSRDASVLNRISSANPTRIDGTLSANGRVYLMNPAGVLFGANSRVDVARLYAVAGQLADADFLRGNDRFTNLSGAVVNHGTITSDFVGLLGGTVANAGTIVSPGGTVVMAAGETVMIGERLGNVFVRIEGEAKKQDGADGSNASNPGTPGTPGTPGAPEAAKAAVENTGRIDARRGRIVMGSGDVYGVALRAAGQLKARQARIEGQGKGEVHVTGTIDATGGRGEKGGKVQVLGEKVAVTGTIDASGPAGGGEILVGGNFQGKGPERNATYVIGTREATLKADATDRGNGGTIIVWSDIATRFNGNISARGGNAGGDGGFAEVSGKVYLGYDGRTDLRAPKGRMGTLLLDPRDIDIVAVGVVGDDALVGAGDNTILFGDFVTGDAITDDLSISASALTGDSSNVVLQANRDIFINTALALGTNAQTITLQAGRNITINNQVTTRGGAITFTADDNGAAGGFGGAGSITLNAALDTTGNAQTGGAITLNIDGGTGAINFGSNGNLITRGGIITINGPAVLAGASGSTPGWDTTGSGATAAGANILIQSTLNGTGAAFDRNIAMNAGTGGSITFSGIVGGTSAPGLVQITNANNVSFLNASTSARVLQQAGSGTTLITGLMTTQGAGGSGGISLTTNAITVNANLDTSGNNATAAVALNAVGGISFDADRNITTRGGTITLSNLATLTGAAASDFGLDTTDGGGAAAGANITISAGLAFAGAGPGGQDVFFNAGTGGTIGYTGNLGAAGNLAGDVTITNANNVNISGTTSAARVNQIAGAGTTTFTGLVTTSAATGIQTSTGTTVFTAGANTTAGNGIITVNGGLRTSANLLSGGTVAQTGAGALIEILGGSDVITTGDAINFAGTLEVGGDVLLDPTNAGGTAAGANITLGAVDADGAAGTGILRLTPGTAGATIINTVGATRNLSELRLSTGTTLTTNAINALTIDLQPATSAIFNGLVTIGAGGLNVVSPTVAFNGGATSSSNGFITVDASTLLTIATANIDIDGSFTKIGAGNTTLNRSVQAGADNTDVISFTGGTVTVGSGVTLDFESTGSGGTVTFGAGTTLALGGNGITITADEIDFLGGANSITGTEAGTLTLQGQQAGTTIGLGNGAGTLSLDATDLLAISNDAVALIQIGRTNQSGTMTIGASGVTFNDAVSLRGSNGTIAVLGTLTGGDAADSTLTLDGQVNALSANLVTSGQAISLSGGTTLNVASVQLDTTNAGGTATGANITVNGTVNSFDATRRSLTLNAGTGRTVAGTATYGQTNPLDAFNILADTVTNLPANRANSLSITVQTGGTYAGLLRSDAGNVTLTGPGTHTVSGGVQTTGGGLVANGAGLLTLQTTALSLGGNFTRTNGSTNIATGIGRNGVAGINLTLSSGTTSFTGASTIDLGTGSFDSTGSGIDLGGQTLVWRANSFTFNGADTVENDGLGGGSLTLAGAADATTIGVGTGAAGTLAFDTTDLAAFANGATGLLVFGGASQTGQVTVGTADFRDAARFQAGGVGGIAELASTQTVTGSQSDATLEFSGTTVRLGGTARTASAGITLNPTGSIIIFGDTTLNTAFGGGGATITINRPVESTVAGTNSLTLTSGTGDITFGAAGTVGANTRLGAVAFTGNNITTRTVTATTITSTPTTLATYQGLLNTNAAGGITLSGLNHTLNAGASTTNGGTFIADNTGLLTIANTLLNLDGAFTRSGASGVRTTSLGANITTTNDAITFASGTGTLTFGANSTLNAGTATITLRAADLAGRDVVLQGNGIDLLGGALSVIGNGLGNLTFLGAANSTTIGVGTGTGTLVLDATDIGALGSEATGLITVGSASQTGQVTIGNASFQDATQFLAGGAGGIVQLDSGAVLEGADVADSNLTLNGATTRLGGTIRTGSRTITVTSGSGTITLFANTIFNTTFFATPGANITLSQAVSSSVAGSNDLTLTAGTGAISLAAIGSPNRIGAFSATGASITTTSVFATTIGITAGTGTYNGILDTSAAGGITLAGTGNHTLNAGANTTNGGTFTATNSGVLALVDGADPNSGALTLDGAFSRTGGTTQLGVDLSTTDDAAGFGTDTTITAAGVAIQTGSNIANIANAATGNVTFGGILDLQGRGLTIAANGISFGGGANSVRSTVSAGQGTLVLRGGFAGTTIGLGTGAGTLSIAGTSFAALQDEAAALIVIGGSVGTGGLDVTGTITADGTDGVRDAFLIQNTAGQIVLTSTSLLVGEETDATISVSGTDLQVGGIIQTRGGAVTLTGPVTLTSVLATIDTTAVGPTATGGNISFSSTVNGLGAGSNGLTLNGGTGGTVQFGGAVGGGTRLGALTVQDALNVNASSIAASLVSITQTASAAASTFSGALNTNAAGGVSLTGFDFDLDGGVTTTNGGDLTIVSGAGGLVRIRNSAASVNGNFAKSGAGTTQLGTNITAAGTGGISFAGGATTLTAAPGPVVLTVTSADAPVTINTTVDGATAAANDFRITAANGIVTLGQDVGGTTRLRDFLVSASGQISSSGAIRGRNIDFTSTGNGTTTFGDVLLTSVNATGNFVSTGATFAGATLGIQSTREVRTGGLATGVIVDLTSALVNVNGGGAGGTFSTNGGIVNINSGLAVGNFSSTGTTFTKNAGSSIVTTSTISVVHTTSIVTDGLLNAGSTLTLTAPAITANAGLTSTGLMDINGGSVDLNTVAISAGSFDSSGTTFTSGAGATVTTTAGGIVINHTGAVIAGAALSSNTTLAVTSPVSIAINAGATAAGLIDLNGGSVDLANNAISGGSFDSSGSTFTSGAGATVTTTAGGIVINHTGAVIAGAALSSNTTLAVTSPVSIAINAGATAAGLVDLNGGSVGLANNAVSGGSFDSSGSTFTSGAGATITTTAGGIVINHTGIVTTNALLSSNTLIDIDSPVLTTINAGANATGGIDITGGDVTISNTPITAATFTTNGLNFVLVTNTGATITTTGAISITHSIITTNAALSAGPSITLNGPLGITVAGGASAGSVTTTGGPVAINSAITATTFTSSGTSFSSNASGDISATGLATITHTDGVTLLGDITSADIQVRSGTDGSGNITSTGARFAGTEIVLDAGATSGSGALLLDGATTFRDLAGTGNPDALTLRQDLSFADSDLPAQSQFGAIFNCMAYTIESRGGTVTINTASKVADTALTLVGTSVTISTGGPLSLCSLNATGLTSVGNSITTSNGDLIFTNRVTLTGDTEFNAGNFQVALLGGADAGTSNLTLTADEINIGNDGNEGLTGTGILTLQPGKDATAILLAGSGPDVASQLDLSTSDLANAQNDAAWSRVIIGRATGFHTISTGGALQLNQRTLVQSPAGAGSITIGNAVTGTSTGQLEFDSGTGNITLGADVQTSGGEIRFRDEVRISGSSVVVSSQGGNINFDAAVEGTGGGGQNLSLGAGTGTVNLPGGAGVLTSLGFLGIDGAAINANNTLRANAITLTGGTVALQGVTTLTGDFASTGSTYSSGAVTSAGNIGLNHTGDINALGLLTAGTFITTNGATTSLTQGASSVGAQLHTASSLRLSGDLTSSAAGAIDINAPLLLLVDGIDITTNGASATDDIFFRSTVDGSGSPFSLNANAGNLGSVVFSGAVGGAQALSTLAAAGASIDLDAPVFNAATIVFNGPASISNSNVTVTASTSATFAGSIDSQSGETNQLVINSPSTTLSGSIGTNAALSRLATDAAGTTFLGAPRVVTTTEMLFQDPVILTSDLVAEGGTGTVNFQSTLDSDTSIARAVTLNASSIRLDSATGGVQALASMAATGVTITTGSVTTTRGQTYTPSTSMTLAGDLRSLAAGAITVGGPLVLAADGIDIATVGASSDDDIVLGVVNSSAGTNRGLTLSAGSLGGIVLDGNIGQTDRLGAVSLAGATTEIRTSDLSALSWNFGGPVTIFEVANITGDTVDFTRLVTLNAGATVVGSGATGRVTFAGDVLSPNARNALAVNAVTTAFNGVVGGVGSELGNLTTDAAGTTTLGGGSINATGNVVFADAIELTRDLTVTNNNASGQVSFQSIISSGGNRAMVVDALAPTFFRGAVGGTNSAQNLASLSVSGGGVTEISSGIGTTGGQTYADAMRFAGSQTLSGSTFTFNSTVNASSGNVGTLTLNSAANGDTTFNGLVGNETPLRIVTNDGGRTRIETNMTLSSGADFGDDVLTGASVTINGGNAPLLFRRTINSASATNRSALVLRSSLLNPTIGATTGAINVPFKFGGDIGAAVALRSLDLGGNLTSTPNVSTIVFARAYNADGSIPATALNNPTGFRIVTRTNSGTENGFQMGQAQKITSFANLEIDTTGGVILGDISTLGTLRVTVARNDAIQLRLRAPGSVLERGADGQSFGTVGAETNTPLYVDLVTAADGSDSILFRNGTTPISATLFGGGSSGDGRSVVRVANNDGSFRTNSQLATIAQQATARAPINAADANEARVTAADFTFGNFALPLDLSSPGGNEPIATAIAGAIPRDTNSREVTTAVTVGKALEEQLAAIAIQIKASDFDEMLKNLVGRSLYQDSPLKSARQQVDYRITVNRMSQETVLAALDAFHALRSEGGRVGGADLVATIKANMDAAWTAYLAEVGEDNASGVGFRTWLESRGAAATPEEIAALDSLNKARVFLEKIANIGLTPMEESFPQQVVLGNLASDMLPNQVRDAVTGVVGPAPEPAPEQPTDEAPTDEPAMEGATVSLR